MKSVSDEIFDVVNERDEVIGKKLRREVHRDGDVACRPKIQQAVLAMSKEQLLRDRSMMLMQGWEPDPKAIPPLDELLAR